MSWRLVWLLVMAAVVGKCIAANEYWSLTGEVTSPADSVVLIGPSGEKLRSESSVPYRASFKSKFLVDRLENYTIVRYGSPSKNASSRSVDVIPRIIVAGKELIATADADTLKEVPDSSKTWKVNSIFVYSTTGQTADDTLALLPLAIVPLYRPEVFWCLNATRSTKFFGLTPLVDARNPGRINYQFNASTAQHHNLTISTPYRASIVYQPNGKEMITVARPIHPIMKISKVRNSHSEDGDTVDIWYQNSSTSSEYRITAKSRSEKSIERIPFEIGTPVFDYRLVATNPTHSSFPSDMKPKRYLWSGQFPTISELRKLSDATLEKVPNTPPSNSTQPFQSTLILLGIAVGIAIFGWVVFGKSRRQPQIES